MVGVTTVARKCGAIVACVSATLNAGAALPCFRNGDGVSSVVGVAVAAVCLTKSKIGIRGKFSVGVETVELPTALGTPTSAVTAISRKSALTGGVGFGFEEEFAGSVGGGDSSGNQADDESPEDKNFNSSKTTTQFREH